MNNTEFKKQCKKAQVNTVFGIVKNYYCDIDNMIIFINLQKSDFNNCYYINYGFCVKDIHNEIQYLNWNECNVENVIFNVKSDARNNENPKYI